MNIRGKAELRQKLSAEYVLGTLRGGARRRFEGWLHQDADLRHITAEWQQRMAPMAEFSTPLAPRKRVWGAIEQRLNLRPRPRSIYGAWQFWRSGSLAGSLSFWRSLGIASSLVAALLVLVMTSRTLDAPLISYVATLNDDKAVTVLVLTADSRHRALDVRLAAGAPGATAPAAGTLVSGDKTLQLWAVPKKGPPRSLGLLADNGRATLALPDNALGADVALLAVSLEPRGGSPDPNGPTGPILYKGSWVRL